MENQLIIALKSIGVFDDVVYSSLSYDNFNGNLITVQEGKILFRENEEANDFYLLISGKIKILDKDIDDENSIIKDKALIGAEDVIKNRSFKSSAIVLTDSYLIKISKEEINYLIEQNNKIYENIEKICSGNKKEDDITKLFKLDLSTNFFVTNSQENVIENKKLTLGELGKINLIDDDKTNEIEITETNEIDEFNEFVKNNNETHYNLSDFLQDKVTEEFISDYPTQKIDNENEIENRELSVQEINSVNNIEEIDNILEKEQKINSLDAFTFDPKEFENIASEFNKEKINLDENISNEVPESEISENDFPPIEESENIIFGENIIEETELINSFDKNIDNLDDLLGKTDLEFGEEKLDLYEIEEKVDEEVEFKFDLKDLEKEIKLFNQNFEEDEIIKKISSEEFNIPSKLNEFNSLQENLETSIQQKEIELENFIVEEKEISEENNPLVDFNTEIKDFGVVEDKFIDTSKLVDENSQDFVNFLKENNLSLYEETELKNEEQPIDYEIKFEGSDSFSIKDTNTLENEKNIFKLEDFKEETENESIFLNPEDFKTKTDIIETEIQNDILSKINIEDKTPLENFYDFEEKNQLIIDDININEPLIEENTKEKIEFESTDNIEEQNTLIDPVFELEIEKEKEGFLIDSESFLKEMESFEEKGFRFNDNKPFSFEEINEEQNTPKEENILTSQEETVNELPKPNFEENNKVREEESLSNENSYITKIMKAAELINSNIKLDDVLSDIVNAATEMTESDRGTLYIYDKKRDELWSKVAMGSEPKEIRLSIGEGIAGWVAKTNEIVNLKDATKDERFNPEYDKNSGYETQSMLCVPIRNKNTETVGVLQLLNSKNGEFRKIDEELLETISIYCSIALENAKLVEKLLQGERELSIGKMANFLIQDIKKPTLVTKRYAEHLRNKDLSNDINQVLDMMLEQINYVADLVQTTSNYAEGSSMLRTTERGVREVLDEFCAKIDSTVKARKIIILPNFDVNAKIKVDPKEFYQCFNHIIKNACDAMPEGGEIRIATFIDNGFVKIRFKDQGMGIPETLIDKIFEPLMSYGKKEGTGLGLSVTKKIIEDHNGKIEVKSELGVGTEVVVSLPEVSF